MDIIEATKREWTELGFHYDRNDDSRIWTITGSSDGIAKFIAILRSFAANPRNDTQFEHEHYGPYGYLKIMNVPDQRGLDGNAVFAPRRDFNILADQIASQIATTKVGSQFYVKYEFCPDSDYDVLIVVKPTTFDPGCFDPWVSQQVASQNKDTDGPNQTGNL